VHQSTTAAGSISVSAQAHDLATLWPGASMKHTACPSTTPPTPWKAGRRPRLSTYLTIGSAGRNVKQVLDHGDPLDRIFRALSDPSRRLMLDRLSRGSASVSELAVPLDMSLAAVVQHVQVLLDSGLINSEKVGRVRTCRLQSPVLRTAEGWISERRRTWERRLDLLGDVLSEQHDDSGGGSEQGGGER
jgi:DNA-binding transcriptional ArsR family regulator